MSGHVILTSNILHRYWHGAAGVKNKLLELHPAQRSLIEKRVSPTASPTFSSAGSLSSLSTPASASPSELRFPPLPVISEEDLRMAFMPSTPTDISSTASGSYSAMSDQFDSTMFTMCDIFGPAPSGGLGLSMNKDMFPYGSGGNGAFDGFSGLG